MINEEKYMFGLKKYQNGMGAVRAAEEAHISYIEFRKFLKEKKVWRDSISYNNLYPQFKNIDSEEKLSALPFITKQLVRKIILERELGSGFRDADDLRNKLGLSDRNARILAQRIDFSFKNKK